MAFFQFNTVSIAGIAAAIPKNIVHVDSFESIPGAENIKMFIKYSGVVEKHISLEEQTTCDLGYVAAKALLNAKVEYINDLGIIVFISKTPDYRNPPTAAVLQHRLKLSKDCLAYDINIGSSGFVYGLQAGCSLLESMPVKFALLIVGDTSSKQFSEINNTSLRFGDGASAILLEKKSESKSIYLSTITESEKYNSYIQRHGGFRISTPMNETEDDLKIIESDFSEFVLTNIPLAFKDFINKTKSQLSDFDIIAMHQEKEDLLREIADALHLPFEKINTNLEKFGNTCGASVPLLLSDVYGDVNNKEINVIACGYGEGFSLGIVSFHIDSSVILPLIETEDFFTEGTVSHDL